MMQENNQPNAVFYLASEEETEKLARNFADFLEGKENQGLTFTFSGELGAGKTTFIRAFLRALGIQGAVKSPTFTLVETYDTPKGQTIHHFDLYRIHEDPEFELPGFRDYFTDKAICCIEWPERAEQILKSDLAFYLKFREEGREIQIEAYSEMGKNILGSVNKF